MLYTSGVQALLIIVLQPTVRLPSHPRLDSTAPVAPDLLSYLLVLNELGNSPEHHLRAIEYTANRFSHLVP